MSDQEKQVEIKEGYTPPEPPIKPREGPEEAGFIPPPPPEKPPQKPPDEKD